MKLHAVVLAGRARSIFSGYCRPESPMPRGIDMSPPAVAVRLREMADVSELCRKLGQHLQPGKTG